jgi:hypothetical protein
VKIIRKAMIMPLTWAGTIGAGEGNRTLMTSLEGWRSAIELRPRARREPLDGSPGRHRQRTGYGTPAPNREGSIQTMLRPTVARERILLVSGGMWEISSPAGEPGDPQGSGPGTVGAAR